MSEELKPCPFCGGEAEIFESAICQIRCSNCNARSCWNTKDKAIEAWNRRAEQ